MPDEDMEQEKEQLIARLKGLKLKESMFFSIMKAQTVQELIDSRFDPEELISLFEAAEELAREEEEILEIAEVIGKKLINIRPVRRRRMFFV